VKPKGFMAEIAPERGRVPVGLYWMWRKEWDYQQVVKFGSQGRKFSSHTVVTKGSIR
jgi:hypothetical protein